MNAHQQCTGRIIIDNIIGPRRLKHPELTLSEKKKNGFHLIFSISIIDEIHLRSVLIDISVKKLKMRRNRNIMYQLFSLVA